MQFLSFGAKGRRGINLKDFMPISLVVIFINYWLSWYNRLKKMLSKVVSKSTLKMHV